METFRKFLADETGATPIGYGVIAADDAKAEIAAAVRYLLKHATDSARGDLVREIIAIVHDAANGLDARAVTQAPMSGVTYKAYVIDAFQRDTDKWRATVRRLDGKKIRIAFPPAVRDDATTTTDALTAEKAVELAKKAIDGGGVI
jgi:Flp pilus assembly pilin Flp